MPQTRAFVNAGRKGLGLSDNTLDSYSDDEAIAELLVVVITRLTSLETDRRLRVQEQSRQTPRQRLIYYLNDRIASTRKSSFEDANENPYLEGFLKAYLDILHRVEKEF